MVQQLYRSDHHEIGACGGGGCESMSQLERSNDFEASLRAQIRAALLQLQTAMPVKITAVTEDGGTYPAYDPTTNTCTCKPIILGRQPMADGTFKWYELPPLIYCPVITIMGGAGGFAFSAPPQDGMEGLAIFSSRAIDNWWKYGYKSGISPSRYPIELRHHDLSDGFVIVGPTSVPNVLPNMSANAQIRSQDGTVYIDFDLEGITIEAPAIALNGPLKTNAIPVAGNTASTFSIPITIGGVVYHIRLSTAP